MDNRPSDLLGWGLHDVPAVDGRCRGTGPPPLKAQARDPLSRRARLERLTRGAGGQGVRRQPVSPLAQMLLACLTEAGMLIARADNKVRSRRELGRAVAVFVAGLSTDRDRTVGL